MLVHPVDCPPFDYEHHPAKTALLPQRVREILADLWHGRLEANECATNSRGIHHRLLRGLTPVDHDYYAGHYRGEPYRCLQFLNVTAGGDSRVGYPWQSVMWTMTNFAHLIRQGIASLDAADKEPRARLPAEHKVLFAVLFVCQVLEFFLRVHPYADGNGHAARFIVWVILARYGYWPKRWRLDPRPEPPYIELIRLYRDGDREPLEKYILSMIV